MSVRPLAARCVYARGPQPQAAADTRSEQNVRASVADEARALKRQHQQRAALTGFTRHNVRASMLRVQLLLVRIHTVHRISAGMRVRARIPDSRARAINQVLVERASCARTLAFMPRTWCVAKTVTKLTYVTFASSARALARQVAK